MIRHWHTMAGVTAFNLFLLSGFIVIFFPATCYSRLPNVIRVGAMFEHGASQERKAFEFGIEQVNRNRNILKNIRLIYTTENVHDVFSASKKVCKLLKSDIRGDNTTAGIAGIFTVIDQSSTDLTSSICETFTVPMLQTTPDISPSISDAGDVMTRMKVNIHPDITTLGQALLDFVISFNWKSVVILYQGNEGLIRVKSVLNAGFQQIKQGKSMVECVFWEMKDIERTLKELRYNVPYKHIIVDIETEQITHFLDVASRMGILTSYHHYMFTSLDLAALNIGKFTWGGVNITGFRMVDTKSSISQTLLRDWVLSSVRPRNEASAMLLNCSSVQEGLYELCGCAATRVTCHSNGSIADDPVTLTDNISKYCQECTWISMSRNALMIDSVHLFAKAVDNYFDGLDDFSTQTINCQSRSNDNMWAAGESIYNEFSSITHNGLTGTIRIDKGKRVDFDLDLIEYDTEGAIQLVGHWNRLEGLNITKSAERRRQEIQKDLNNKTLRVVVKEEHPFIFVNDVDVDGNPIPHNSNDRFSGYAKDMLTAIAHHLNLTFTMQLVPDGSTGRALENGSWTGMIGMLMTNQADLAVGDLTINFERSSVIDFTKPFMNLGISILFKRPEPDPPKLFSFLEPLNNKIWMCMIGAYTFVSLFLFVVARFSPYEWKNPHPCNPESDMVENDFTLLNSFWFTIGSLMQQGCELAPKASSTRIIAGVWWFFTLILISSYTANLAAFLTITRMTAPIKNADDLAKQTSIKYGCQYGGSTFSFFKHSEIPTYKKMGDFMAANPDVFVNNSNLGIAKVKSGKYAYLMESIPLRYQLSKHCDLMEIGGELDSKGYGIGVPKDSPYRDSLSNAILNLSERQVLLNLYNKWWNVDNPQCDTTEESKSPTAAAQLGMNNLGGVFVFLIGGLALALLIALIEFLINAFVNSKADKQTLCSEINEECRFAVKCWGPSEKPVKLPIMNGHAGNIEDLESSEALKSMTMDTSFT